MDPDTIKWILGALKDLGVNAVLAGFLIGAIYLWFKKREEGKPERESSKNDDDAEEGVDRLDERCERIENDIGEKYRRVEDDIKKNSEACERRAKELHDRINAFVDECGNRRKEIISEIALEVRKMASDNFTTFNNIITKLGQLSKEFDERYIQEKHLGPRVKEIIREHCDQCQQKRQK